MKTLGGFLGLKMYRSVKRDGITAVLINKRRILLLKRLNAPLMSHPGMWSFLSGGRRKGERYLQTAYREIFEETGIRAERLALLDGNSTIVLKDEGKGLKWQNRFFIFRASGRAVRLNVENTDYKWVGFGQVCRNRDIDRMIYNKEKVRYRA